MLLVIARVAACCVQEGVTDRRIGEARAPLPLRTGPVCKLRERLRKFHRVIELAVSDLPEIARPDRQYVGINFNRHLGKRGSFAANSRGEVGGLLQHELVVHEHQRLSGDGRSRSLVAVAFHDRSIEGSHERFGFAALLLDIHAAPRQIADDDLPDEILSHQDRFSEHRIRQRPARDEHSIAHHLRIQPPHVHATEQLIARIDGVEFWSSCGGLTVCC